MKAGKWLARKGVQVGVGASRVLASLLPWRAAVGLGKRLGVTAYYLLFKERTRVFRHLKMALGDKYADEELRVIARNCFAHLGMGFFELLLAARLPKERLKELIVMEGEEIITEACRNGKGVIFVTGHIGNWELMGAALSMRYRLRVIAAPLYDPWLDAMMVRFRARFGIETIQRGSPRAGRQILSALRQGGVLGLLIDQDTRVEGAYVNFFGRPAYTPTAAAALALRTRIPVVIGSCHRMEDGTHRVVVQGPLALLRTGEHQRDLEENTALFSKCLEDIIRKRPEQWVWMHRRWASRPSEH